MGLLDIFTNLKDFGFPIIVAIWALWRLDKSWGKSEGIHYSLDQLEGGANRIEMALGKQADIQQEMLVTLRILHSIISNGGGDR